jgi:hypothetical protein
LNTKGVGYSLVQPTDLQGEPVGPDL